MLTKILFTVAVIVVVMFVFRHRNQPSPVKNIAPAVAEQSKGITPQMLAYIFIVLIMLVSGLLYLFYWMEQNTIVNIKVIDAGGEAFNYQAHKKSIEGKEFTTLDGRRVTLGDSDRVEMIEND
ncbi:MAG: hypothetical protein OER96_02695 [Gammaproteobacteria bacterium]|nr:hypothetical protein [Gammaproteobacteria bacterium]